MRSTVVVTPTYSGCPASEVIATSSMRWMLPGWARVAIETPAPRPGPRTGSRRRPPKAARLWHRAPARHCGCRGTRARRPGRCPARRAPSASAASTPARSASPPRRPARQTARTPRAILRPRRARVRTPGPAAHAPCSARASSCSPSLRAAPSPDTLRAARARSATRRRASGRRAATRSGRRAAASRARASPTPRRTPRAPRSANVRRRSASYRGSGSSACCSGCARLALDVAAVEVVDGSAEARRIASHLVQRGEPEVAVERLSSTPFAMTGPVVCWKWTTNSRSRAPRGSGSAASARRRSRGRSPRDPSRRRRPRGLDVCPVDVERRERERQVRTATSPCSRRAPARRSSRDLELRQRGDLLEGARSPVNSS